MYYLIYNSLRYIGYYRLIWLTRFEVELTSGLSKIHDLSSLYISHIKWFNSIFIC